VKDFFISYNSADKGWAEWIAWQLEEEGYETILQAWDFRPGYNFMIEMDEASRKTKQTIAVLSPDYFKSDYCKLEAFAALVEDPASKMGRLLTIRVREYEKKGLMQSIVYIDLLGLDEEAAKKALLAGIKSERAKPSTPPGFPASRSVTEKPRFPGALPSVWNVPFNRNPNFTGRRSLLTDLHDALNSGQYAALTQAITGLGGVGKTQLALEYVYSYIDEYEAIWWVRSEEPSTLAADYVGLAVALKLPESRLEDQRIVAEAVRRRLGQLEGWLLIFDNAGKPKNIDAYLPQGGGGHVIITSRNQDWDVLAREMPIRVFEEDEAIEFILKRTGEDNPESAKELAKELDNLPLALEQACAYIKTRNKSIAGYVELFRQRKTELLKFPISRKDYDYTVATTWNISFQQVREESEAGTDLLHLCAFLAPDNIPKSLISGGAEHLPEPLASAVADELKFSDAIAALNRYSLINFKDDYYSIHRLVQAIARDRLSNVQRKIWRNAAVRVVNNAFPQECDDLLTWNECEVLLPHALAATETVEENGSDLKATGHLLNRAGVYLSLRGSIIEAKTTHDKVISIFKCAYPNRSKHPDMAKALSNLGNELVKEGDLKGAEECYVGALTIMEEYYGSDSSHPELAMAHTNLGLFLRKKGDLKGAKEHCVKALGIQESFCDSDLDHRYAVKILVNLGLVLSDNGELKRAKRHYLKALNLCKEIRGEYSIHPDRALTLTNLGGLLAQMKDLDGAKKCFEDALKIKEELYGIDSYHPDMASTLSDLGVVQMLKGDLNEAKKNFNKSLEIDRCAYGTESNHPDSVPTLYNLGIVLEQEGNLKDAEESLVRALTILEAFCGLDNHHPYKTKILLTLCAIKLKRGDFSGATKNLLIFFEYIACSMKTKIIQTR